MAAALCHKVLDLRSCKELRKAKKVVCVLKNLSGADLATLATLGPVLPALEELRLYTSPEYQVHDPDGVQRLFEGLGAGALPALIVLRFNFMHLGDAGAPALAAALGRGALPHLKMLSLWKAGIGDAGLVTLAPALRRLPWLDDLDLSGNLFGDEGLAALVAPPPPPPGALPPPTEGLAKLKTLELCNIRMSDAGCAALAAAIDSGALPALEDLRLYGIPASAAAKVALARFKLPLTNW